MKIGWIIEEKLRKQHKCPSCRKIIDNQPKLINTCEYCEYDTTNYIYFRLNVKYFGIRKALQ